MPRPSRLEMFRQALWVALIPGAVLFLVMQVVVHISHGMVGADSHAYWAAARWPETWYTRPPAHWDAYLYSPAFAQALWPVGRLPWHVFQVLWAGAQVATLWWLLRPLGTRRALTLAPFLVTEVLLGNVYIFFAGALALAIGRAPGALALPILTKIAPGVVGLWLVVRGEWRGVVKAATVTLAVAAVSVLIAPGAWVAWGRFIIDNSTTSRGGFAALRLVVAVLVIVWAARRSQAWLLAPAMILACPVLGGYGPLALLAAVPRLLEWQRAQSARDGSEQDEALVSSDGDPVKVAL